MTTTGMTQRGRGLELMAPAGNLEAGFAAFQHGADAVYTGLKKFSARADADNLTPAELDELCAYAHALEPRRRVFLTVNTLVLDGELPALLPVLAAAEAAEVDALIVQDLGVVRLVQRHFPSLRLHSSTQMAVHNQAGVETLKRLGFARVTLAREMTLADIRTAAAVPGVEVEAFVHGALCTSYSGLCLFSSHVCGRSGNRGQCAYLCRDAFRPAIADGTPPATASEPASDVGDFLFSMKDLALLDDLDGLRQAGVASLKIEGRKKSPLHVAAVTHAYRRFLDGPVSPGERAVLEADMRSIFSRKWTSLYMRDVANPDVTDREFVGHRGLPIGTVAAIARDGAGRHVLRFRTEHAIERHDGLQIETPGSGWPFGFPVDDLRIIRTGGRPRPEPAFAAEAGSDVEIGLPSDFPRIPVGAKITRASSQAVKRRYTWTRPRPGEFRTRRALHVRLRLEPDGLTAELSCTAPGSAAPALTVSRTIAGPFGRATTPALLDKAARETFAKLGGTGFTLGTLVLDNPQALFVPVSRVNAIRRETVAALETAFEAATATRLQQLAAALWPVASTPAAAAAPAGASDHALAWSIKVAEVAFLDAFDPRDLADIDEVTVNVHGAAIAAFVQQLESVAARVGNARIRLALPLIARDRDLEPLRAAVAALRHAGWRKWEVPNIYGWNVLGVDPRQPPAAAELDLRTDWSVYVLNHIAAEQLHDMGASGIVLSPEDSAANMAALFGARRTPATVVIYQDTPLMISETCPFRGHGCAGGSGRCLAHGTTLESTRAGQLDIVAEGCRLILLGRRPFCLGPRLDELRAMGARRVRADFVFRRYRPETVVDVWRRLRAGHAPPGHIANFDRGLA